MRAAQSKNVPKAIGISDSAPSMILAVKVEPSFCYCLSVYMLCANSKMLSDDRLSGCKAWF